MPSVNTAKVVWALLIRGALTHPTSMVLAKLLGRPASTGKANALNGLAMASTVWLILCCAMAYGLFLLPPPVAAAGIGGAIEVLFAGFVLARSRRVQLPPA